MFAHETEAFRELRKGDIAEMISRQGSYEYLMDGAK